MEENIIIRTLKPDEIEIPVLWALQEGWNPGIHDAGCHYVVDPQGWFCAEKSGEIIGVVVGVNYDDTFSFGGFYIVKPEYRNHGMGLTLCSRMFEHVGDRNFGCDGVFDMQDKYIAKIGLKFAYRNIRWQGIGKPGGKTDLITATDVPFDLLLAYDSLHFPAKRRSFLQKWIRQPEGVSLVKMNSEGFILGYGVIRRCFEGYKIGPLFADTLDVANEIFDALAGTVPGEILFFDTPEPNTEAVRMATERGMTEVFGTARMYSKTFPNLPLHQIFGVTTFELG
jgi:hypothetical protein